MPVLINRPLLIVILGLVTTVGPLSLDMYLPALPEIARDLRVSPAEVQLSLTSCLVGMALGQLVFGPLSDRWGRRRPVVAGLFAYAMISFLIALAPTSPALTGLRFLQGLAGGAGVVVARAVVRDVSSGAAAAKLYSSLILVFGLAPIAAPSLGSLVLRLTSWHGIFVALGVIALLLTALVAIGLPETLPASRRSRGGLAAISRTAGRVIRDRTFLGYALAQSFTFAALFAYLAGSSFALQNGYGLSPTAYSLLFGANAVALIVLSQANNRLLNRWSLTLLMYLGLAVQCCAGVLALVGALTGNLIVLAAGLFLLVGAIAVIQPNTTALALDRYPANAGAAAALLGGAQSVIASAAAPLAGIGDPGQGVPMSVVILSFAVAALLATVALTSSS
ncbi:multidrug effflux MFS transporter [Actinoplanes sp. NPDC051861]|uniref:multidrug effflux MFS transporter n=1 Tax=Actinoplanes sp. NPDC051861 TaxID=3155170 RepID=UPI0034440E8A